MKLHAHFIWHTRYKANILIDRFLFQIEKYV